MKNLAILGNGALSLTTCAILTGCLYGQCINGPCALEHSAIVNSTKPYGKYWVKSGMTTESRLDDIESCGSARTEYIGFSAHKIRAAQKTEDPNEIAAYLRLREEWAKCMESKGYHSEKQ